MRTALMILITVIYVLYAGPAAGQEAPAAGSVQEVLAKRVSFEFIDTPLSAVTAFVGTVTDNRITVAVDTAEIPAAFVRPDGSIVLPINLLVEDLQLDNAIFWIARQTGLTWELQDSTVMLSKAEVLTAPMTLHVKDEQDTAWYQALRKRLERPITFELVETPLRQAARVLTKTSGITVILDPSVFRDEKEAGPGRTVTLRAEGLSGTEVIQLFEEQTGLHHTIAREAVLFAATIDIKSEWERDIARRTEQEHRDKEQWELSETNPDNALLWERLRTTRQPLAFADVHLSDALRTLSGFLETPVRLDRLALEGRETTPRVTLMTNAMSVYNGLYWVTRRAQLAYFVQGGRIVVNDPKNMKSYVSPLQTDARKEEWYTAILARMEHRISFDLMNAPLEEVIEFLAEVTGISMIVEWQGEVLPVKITFKADNMPLREILDQILTGTGLRYTIAREAVIISNAPDVRQFIFLPGAWTPSAE